MELAKALHQCRLFVGTGLGPGHLALAPRRTNSDSVYSQEIILYMAAGLE